MAHFIQGTDLANEVARKYMVTYVNAGTSAAKEWYAVGSQVETSGVNVNMSVTTVMDILGETTASIDSVTVTQDISKFVIKRDSKLGEKLFDIWYSKEWSKLEEFEVMIVYGFDGADGAYTAEMHKNCTLSFTTIGGSRQMEIPFTITFSNDITRGTGDYATHNNSIEFTAEV